MLSQPFVYRFRFEWTLGNPFNYDILLKNGWLAKGSPVVDLNI